jgi:hypothetical protein
MRKCVPLAKRRWRWESRPRKSNSSADGVSTRTVAEYYDLLVQEALALRERHGGQARWWQRGGAGDAGV